MNRWDDYAGSDAFLEILRCIAIQIYNKHKHKKAFDKFTENAREESVEIITHKLWEFFSSRSPERITQILDLLDSGQTTFFLKKIQSMSFSFIKDQLRDPYYRHVRDVLSRTDGICYFSERDRSFYAWTHYQELPIVAGSVEDKIEYDSWPLAPGQLSLDSGLMPARKESVQAVAEFFWKEMILFLGDPCMIPIRELVRYIRAVHSTDLDEITFSDLEVENNTGEHVLPFDENLEVSAAGLPLAIAKEVALEFWDNMNDWDKRLFCMNTVDGKTMNECASILGYSHASGIGYHIKRINHGLKNKLKEVDPDTQDDAIRILKEILVDFCKNRD